MDGVEPHTDSAAIEALLQFPRYSVTDIILFGKSFKIVDSLSFYWSYKEIFEHEIYRFTANKDVPFIIDGGSNVGVSILFFKRLYPGARIIGFEPDPNVFEALKDNIATYQLHDVALVNKALWTREETISFMSEGADGGRVLNHIDAFPKLDVTTIRLHDFLHEQVDFLKLDIEGAEVAVILDCSDVLDNVQNIFVEYHSFQKETQRLDELLAVLRMAGFRYQIHTQFAASKPLIERHFQLGMDLQLNIFGYRV